MNSERAGSVETVIGPAGKPLTVENLPPKNTMRWVIRRKAEVVAAVRNGRIGRDEACEHYRKGGRLRLMIARVSSRRRSRIR